jgi:TatD DNase family protein
MIIDSHAHLTFKEYSEDLEDVIARSLSSDTQIINASSNYETSVMAVDLAKKYDGMWAVVGCHPDDLSLSKSIEQEDFKKLANSSPKVVGVGEVGLDFYRLPADKNEAEKIKQKQIEAFKQFIGLAQELNLPLVLHSRGEPNDPYGAYDLMLEILGKWQMANGKLKGVIHCYGGNLGQAKKFLDLGFYIGFTGIVTFKNAKELQAIVKEIPLDKILIETDAPFLAPEPFRGQRNEPAYVKYVAQKIADLKEISFEEVTKATYENTCRLFNL